MHSWPVQPELPGVSRSGIKKSRGQRRSRVAKAFNRSGVLLKRILRERITTYILSEKLTAKLISPMAKTLAATAPMVASGTANFRFTIATPNCAEAKVIWRISRGKQTKHRAKCRHRAEQKSKGDVADPKSEIVIDRVDRAIKVLFTHQTAQHHRVFRTAADFIEDKPVVSVPAASAGFVPVNTDPTAIALFFTSARVEVADLSTQIAQTGTQPG